MVHFTILLGIICSWTVIVAGDVQRSIKSKLSVISKSEFLRDKNLQPSAFIGFPITSKAILDGASINSECKSVLLRNVSCDLSVQTLGGQFYHGSLGDASLTAEACSSRCAESLAFHHHRIVSSCGTDTVLSPGFPIVSLIDKIWGGWNETCVMDLKSGKYCNDEIDSWPPVENGAAMPKPNLCSYCYKAKLEVMRMSPYSVYDAGTWKPRYDEVLKRCGGTGQDTSPVVDGYSLTIQAPSKMCPVGKKYRVKAGDTCASVALSRNVSSSSLYALNPTLYDCAKPKPGLDLCLPPSCDLLYEVRANDNCTTISAVHGISVVSLVAFNGLFDMTCSTLKNLVPSWAKILCLSPPAGTFKSALPKLGESVNSSGLTSLPRTGVNGASGNGYANRLVRPPAGARIASNTTLQCGGFYQVRTDDTCGSILVNANTPATIFIAANPSLVSVSSCDKKLKPGLTYCLHPLKEGG